MSAHGSYWMGRPIAELSREELFEVIDHLMLELRRYHEPDRVKAYSIGKARMFVESALAGREP